MALRKAPLNLAPNDDEARPATPSEWRLPSGQDLVSFAIATGFVAQPLLVAQPLQDLETRPGFGKGVGGRKEVQDGLDAGVGVRREG